MSERKSRIRYSLEEELDLIKIYLKTEGRWGWAKKAEDILNDKYGNNRKANTISQKIINLQTKYDVDSIQGIMEKIEENLAKENGNDEKKAIFGEQIKVPEYDTTTKYDKLIPKMIRQREKITLNNLTTRADEITSYSRVSKYSGIVDISKLNDAEAAEMADFLKDRNNSVSELPVVNLFVAPIAVYKVGTIIMPLYQEQVDDSMESIPSVLYNGVANGLGKMGFRIDPFQINDFAAINFSRKAMDDQGIKTLQEKINKFIKKYKPLSGTDVMLIKDMPFYSDILKVD